MDDKSNRIMQRIAEAETKYFKSNKAADDWVLIPKHILSQIIHEECALNEKEKNYK